MTDDDDPRLDPPVQGSETEVLLGFLEYHRDTFELKTRGLDAAQLDQTLPPSSMTLGGMLKHLAYVESWWFREVFAGIAALAPFDTAPWDDDHDWDWHSASDDDPAALRDLWSSAVTESRRVTADALAGPDGVDQLSALPSRRVENHFNLRWILVHMIEEYCRHNGHADLIRESIDGQPASDRHIGAG
ncbi:MAG: DinB family protein [Desertimonas sp.]